MKCKPVFRSIVSAIVLLAVLGTPLEAADLPAEVLTRDYARTILRFTDPATGIPPSHIGHPGFDRLAFLYDISVCALLLKAAGSQNEALRIMDYLTGRLRTSPEEIAERADSNRVMGIVKRMPDDVSNGLVNSLDVHSPRLAGRGHLEFLTTPGPLSFVIMAFLHVDEKRYLSEALMLGRALLSMQDSTGAVIDGDRNVQRVNTEPHMDAMNVFYELYEITRDPLWRQAADRAKSWFREHVFFSAQGRIAQGTLSGEPVLIFATDVYSWTLAGHMADDFTDDEIVVLTRTMLDRSLVDVTVALPGGRLRRMVLADFADALDQEVVDSRGAVRPMGSPEWTGGVILALQKNAVRFRRKGQDARARSYKAMAEFLLAEVVKSGYISRGVTMFFYASGQGIEVGHGWKTPYFYVPSGQIEGGSLVGGWFLLPMNGLNPFIIADDYFKIYRDIPITAADRQDAADQLRAIASVRRYREPAVRNAVDPRTQIVEPGHYNRYAWEAFNRGRYAEATDWARKVVENFHWVELAVRENQLKQQALGGLVDYPWGQTYRNNENPLHDAVLKYPLLNEVALAMWLLASSYFEQNDESRAVYWIERIVREVPLHQIPHVAPGSAAAGEQLIDGYWNALVSWSGEIHASPLDRGMGALIRDRGLIFSCPATVQLKK